MAAAVAVITAIGAGLKLIDQFRNLVLAWKRGKENVEPPSATAEKVGDKIVVKQGGMVYTEIDPARISLDRWAQPRYDALWRRVEVNWALFNELYAQEAGLSPEESARVKIRMETIRGALCVDFREIVKIYEDATGKYLPDHYHLFDTCQ
jgi:hypothetical protein